tara:strand:+ start:350 stop:595 length:246 start_codon:yes stop_codon:yes gene_type:complete
MNIFKEFEADWREPLRVLMDKIDNYGGVRFMVLKDHGNYLMRHKKGTKTIESDLFKSQTEAAKNLLAKLKKEYGEGNESRN